MHPKLTAITDHGAHTISPQLDTEEIPLRAFVTFINCHRDKVFVGLGNRSVQTFSVGDGLMKNPLSGFSIGGLPICAVNSGSSTGVMIGTDNSQLLHVDAELRVVSSLKKGWIEQLDSTGNGLTAFSCGKTAHIINSEGKHLHEIIQNQGTITGVKFNNDGSKLALARYGGVSIWNPLTGQQLEELEWQGAHLNLSWSPDQQYIVTATPDKEVHCWEVASKKSFRMSGYPGKIRSLCWTADKKHLAAAGADSVTVWPFVNGNPSGKPPYEFGYSFQGIVTRVAAHPSDTLVAAGYSNGTILIGRYTKGEALIARAPLGVAISALAWSADGDYLFAGTESGNFARIGIQQAEI